MVDLKTIENFVGAIAGIIILAAIVGLILNSVGSSIGDTDGFTELNETITGASLISNNTLARESISNLTGIIVTNSTEVSPVIDAGNFTVIHISALGDNAAEFNFQLKGGSRFNGTDLNITYTGSQINTKGNILRNGTETIANVTENLPIAGLVLGFGFILVVLFAALRTIREGGDQGSRGGEF